MTLPAHYDVPTLSGERFRVIYHLTGDEAEARAKAEAICLEQTVEFPGDLVPPGDIRESIIGQLDDLAPVDDQHFAATISYANEIAGAELTQLLNVIFGNSSILPGIRVERLDLSPGILALYKGPRFGQAGLRDVLHAHDRPLLATALKPMGLSPEEMAKMAYQCALGGIDIIKDDHGLADQVFCRYEARVLRCSEAVAKANQETGLHCVYMPNISAPADKMLDRALFAKQAGAGGLMVCPGLTGLDIMRQLADDDLIALPIMSHPAFHGSYVTCPDNGISHFALYGQMMRLAGADMTVYPNYGGRFSFSRAECRSIVEGSTVPMGDMKTIFPAPGGGMKMERVDDMRAFYGQDVIYLIGGGLHRHSDDLAENARYFFRMVTG